MAVGLVLPFTSLTAAQKQPVQQQEYNYKAESEALMKAISLAVDSKLEEHHGCISNKCALSSATPDQHQIVTSSKSSATTQQQLQSGPSVDTRPLRSSWKLTSQQARKGRYTDRTTRW